MFGPARFERELLGWRFFPSLGQPSFFLRDCTIVRSTGVGRIYTTHSTLFLWSWSPPTRTGTRTRTKKQTMNQWTQFHIGWDQIVHQLLFNDEEAVPFRWFPASASWRYVVVDSLVVPWMVQIHVPFSHRGQRDDTKNEQERSRKHYDVIYRCSSHGAVIFCITIHRYQEEED